MSVLNNKLTWLLAIVVLTLALVFYKSFQAMPTGYVPVAAASLNDDEKKINLTSASTSLVVEPKNEKINKNPTKESYVALTPAETGELKSWVAARGYFSKEDESVYETYSDQVLDELGKQGDMRALNVLSSRMVKMGNIPAAVHYANMNVVLGSTTALDKLTLFTFPSVYEKDEVRIRSAILETLAIAQVMSLRGDKTLANVSMHDTANSYKSSYKTDLNLTDSEQQFVEKRGQELYDTYQQIRRDKGLGDFDNEDPSPVKRFFENIFGAK